MKKNLFFAALAITALVSCSESDYLGDEKPSSVSNDVGAISFNLNVPAITRADHVGADAADMLGENFYVGGYKYVGSAFVDVFDNYKVEWDDNTAGTTTDNTSDWKYVGVTAPGFTNHVTGTQTLKYWDYAASYYDFVAYSPGKGNSIVISGDPNSNQILATAIASSTLTTAAYTLQGSADDLAECYIADLITAKESGATTPDINYKDEVTIKFRRLGAKVRVALYETIPGYSVRNVYFYPSASANSTDVTSATLFTSSNVFYPNGTMTVKFPTIGTDNRSKTDYNKAHVTFAGTGTATSTKDFGTLNYEATKTNWEDTRLNYTGNANTYLKRTSTDPSFAGTSPYYVTVLPDEEGNVLELRVDYTLESIDGSKETITVHGATAFVPQIYAAWKPNYAYTYIFKISDNTNGWTKALSQGDPGLYPITFDAIVADSEEGTQSTITTVATPSITTYMKGHNYSTDGPEYKASTTDSIYISVMGGSTLKSDLDAKGILYTVTGDGLGNLTEADVMDALNVQASQNSGTIVGRNGFTLTPATSVVANATNFTTIPGADGNPITGIAANTAVRFLPAAGTYAYVYDTGTDGDDKEIHTAVTFNSEPDNWSSVYNTYYTDEACTIAATSTFDTTATYYQKYTNLNKVYSVKVIRVVAAQQQGGGGNG